MKAYLIDPEARTVTEVQIDARGSAATLEAWRELMRCQWVQDVRPLNAGTDILLLDEEGKFHPQGYFICRLYPYEVLTGPALWLGTDGASGVKDPDMTLEYVTAHIAFPVVSHG